MHINIIIVIVAAVTISSRFMIFPIFLNIAVGSLPVFACTTYGLRHSHYPISETSGARFGTQLET